MSRHELHPDSAEARHPLPTFAEPELVPLETLVRDLQGSPAETRCQVVEKLAQYGEAALPALASLLRDRDPPVRLAVVRVLGSGSAGTGAVDLLCRALEDKDQDTRMAAVEALGRVGDERALQPLTEALHRCFIGGSARWNLVIGSLAALLLVALVCGYISGMGALKMGGGTFIVWHWFIRPVWNQLREARKARSTMCRLVTEALAQIAERSPAPQLHAVVGDLKLVAADVVQQEKQTRLASRLAAARIESLTEKIKSLPTPSAAPHADTTTLPRPADGRSSDTEDLPVVRA